MLHKVGLRGLAVSSGGAEQCVGYFLGYAPRATHPLTPDLAGRPTSIIQLPAWWPRAPLAKHSSVTTACELVLGTAKWHSQLTVLHVNAM